MKKLIAVSAVAALAATALSAEITFGSWGRALWVAAANAYNKTEDKSEVVTDIHQSWGGTAPRTALGVSGDSDNVGFKLDIHSNAPENLQQGDNAYIWVKPIDIVKLSVGRMDDTTLRGDCVNGLWDWDRIGCVDGDEGWTFGGYFQNRGVNVQVTPVEGLMIGAALPIVFGNGNPDGKNDTRTLATVLGKQAAYLGSYKIEGVGTVKAALKMKGGNAVMPKPGDFATAEDPAKAYAEACTKAVLEGNFDKDGKEKESWQEIAVAFDLTSVENLFASVGAVVPTLNSKAYKVNAYARYGVNEQLTVHARVGTKINAYDAKKSSEENEWKTGFGFLAGAGVDYALEDGIGLFADVRYANNIYASGTSADKSDCLTIGAGVTKGFSNGKIGAAFEGCTNGKGRYTQKKAEDFSWEIPVKFEYWF